MVSCERTNRRCARLVDVLQDAHDQESADRLRVPVQSHRDPDKPSIQIDRPRWAELVVGCTIRYDVDVLCPQRPGIRATTGDPWPAHCDRAVVDVVEGANGLVVVDDGLVPNDPNPPPKAVGFAVVVVDCLTTVA